MSISLIIVILIIWIVVDARLPDVSGKKSSYVIGGSEQTHLGQLIAPIVDQHSPQQAGITPISDGQNDFATRILLAGEAQRSLDIQTYIWSDDTTGRLMFEAAHQAADRGVRVRLLIDDNNTAGLDPALAMLERHPNIEVRLTNPFAQRTFRAIGYATDFSRLNHRMHNKSFTVDNQVAVIGGRNIGDDYFAISQESNFVDLDVIVIGGVVQSISSEFDRYWNSEAAYPVSILLKNIKPLDEADFKARIGNDPAVIKYREAIAKAPSTTDLISHSMNWEWNDVRLINDEPEKLLSPTNHNDEQHLLPQLEAALGSPKTELDIVSPYFVPSKGGTETFNQLASSGVRVRVLTNSLAATDVVAVQAGYARRRKALLSAGVQLFELKPVTGENIANKHTIMGSSNSSLHAKTYGADRTRVFVGSFNMDPRSDFLNTEMGLVINSPLLAGRLSGALDKAALKDAYEVRLAPNGDLEWVDGSTVLTTEPETSRMRRAMVDVLSYLPIEWLL